MQPLPGADRCDLDDAPIDARLRDAMRARGFHTLTAVQRAVLAPEATDRNLRISSQTGSGKTVALGLVLGRALGDPAATRGTRAIVVTPTRELAMQVRQELDWLFARLGHVRVEVVTGGSDIARERRALRDGPTVLVATPGRLHDHIRRGAVRCDAVAHLVLDEADRMLDMGFRDDLEAIVAALPPQRRAHLVSATFPPQVRRLAAAVQADALAIHGTALGLANGDIEHVASVVDRVDTYAAVVNTLLQARDEKVLVFVERRVDATELADGLVRDGFSAQSLSGDLSQAQRNRALEGFRCGVASVLVSTDVGARGLDVPDIGLVIQVDVPRDPDDYTHRSGRTGRAGRKGRSLLLVTPREQPRARAVLRAAGVEASWQPLPTIDEIRDGIAATTQRRALEMLAQPGTEHARVQAAALLHGRDPVDVVAGLLALCSSQLPCEPKLLQRPAASAPTRAAGQRKRMRATGTFVRFSINWGHRKGATSARVLSHVCRRGDIDSSMVGAIEIGPGAATFEVADAVASGFEARVREPDTRDRGLWIERRDRPTG